MFDANEFLVKLADFGSVFKLNENNVIEMKGKELSLWLTAPEIFETSMTVLKSFDKLFLNRNFNQELARNSSVVWSYAVLLWEIFSNASEPYKDLKFEINEKPYVNESERVVEKLKDKLKAGYRMNSPHACPVDVYNLMNKCWTYEFSERPTFEQVLCILINITQSSLTL